MGTTNAAYDPNGNLKTQTDAASRTLRYTYDANNRIATVSEDNNATQWWHFEVLGNVALVTDASASVKVAQVVDALGVLRFSSTPGAPKQNTGRLIGDDNGITGFPGTCPALADRALAMTALCFGPPQGNDQRTDCRKVLKNCVQGYSDAFVIGTVAVGVATRGCLTTCTLGANPLCVLGCFTGGAIAELVNSWLFRKGVAKCQKIYNDCVNNGGKP